MFVLLVFFLAGESWARFLVYSSRRIFSFNFVVDKVGKVLKECRLM